MSLDPRILDSLQRRIADLREAISGFDQANWDNIEKKRSEADHLALYIHLLVNNYGRDVSLLKQAGLYDQILAPDTTKVPIVPGVNDTQFAGSLSMGIKETHDGSNILSPLVKIKLLRGPSLFRGMFVPRIGAIENAPLIGLPDWWNGVIGPDGEKLSRREICRIVRSQDGIGHFDAVLADQEYLRLAGYELGRVWVEEVGDDTAICVKSELGEISRMLMVASAPGTGAQTPPSTSMPQPIVNGVSSIIRQIAGELDKGLRFFGV